MAIVKFVSFAFFSLVIIVTTFGCSKKEVPIECVPKEEISIDSVPVDNSECTSSETEINGVSFVATSTIPTASEIAGINEVKASWITVMPFGFISTGGSEVQFNSSFQWAGEKEEGIIEAIKLAHAQGTKVMVKPHIWLMGSWVGDLEFSNETDWKSFEGSYLSYILAFATIADSMDADAFCIGVELKKSVVQRPAYWKQIIDTVKTIYSGELTYASNWDNYQNVPFWSDLDYIGIDAYFPVSDKQTPTFDDCYNGWESNFNAIKSFSNTKNKKVVFTEFGYRNINFTGKEPWDEDNNSTFNSKGQENAYQALFCRFWNEDWFAGGFLWKWFPNHANSGGENDNRFTPQNKPVQEIIKNIYEETN